MRKDLKDMTPDELRLEKLHQEEHFQHLVSHLPPVKNSPKTWYAKLWYKWEELVVTTAKIIFGTILICGIVYGGMWFAIVFLSAL